MRTLRSNLRVLSLVGLLTAWGVYAWADVVTYPVPSCYTASDQLTVTANGVAVPVLRNTAIYDYCTFSSDDTLTITVRADVPITSFQISPAAYHLQGAAHGNSLTFSVYKPSYLIVKVNDLRTLVIAADKKETDVPRSSGPGIYNVTAAPFGATGNGTTYDTKAVQGAIDAANGAGGGIVYVPAGTYLCGHVVLKSNVSVYLAGGAVLRGSGKSSDYTQFWSKKLDGVHETKGTYFVYTDTSTTPLPHDIKVYGRGTIDGNGYTMRTVDNCANDVLAILSCSRFTLDGVVVRDGGYWSTMPTRSNHVVVRNTKIFQENDVLTQDDALDVQESQDVLVDHVVGISQDDTFSTKTWSRSSAAWGGAPQALARVTFNDCLAWTRYAAFKGGDGDNEDQSDVTFQNSYVYQCREAFKVTPHYGAATFRDFTFRNMDVEGYWPRTGHGAWLLLDMANVTASHCTGVHFEHINLRSVGTTGSTMRGYDATHLLEGVTFTDVFVGDEVGLSAAALNITNTNAYVAPVSFTRTPVRQAKAYLSKTPTIAVEPCLDVGAGESLGRCENGAVVSYDGVDFGSGSSLVELRLASVHSGGRVQVMLDRPAGTPVATVEVANTGGWQSWTSLTAPLAQPVSGRHRVYLVFSGSGPLAVASLNWFSFR